MKKILIFLTAFLLIQACATIAKKHKTLTELREGKKCIFVKPDLTWQEVKENLKEPDETPLPELAKRLDQVARGYKNLFVLFHVERKKKENDRPRFYEAVTEVELCK